MRTTAAFPLLFLSFLLLGQRPATAQEKPYFVTYSHDLEEPGNLEIENKTALARPDGGNHYGAMAFELEYGARAWWTTELYLDGQATARDSAIFTGFRLENRVRPLMREHFINPVLYVEYENISGGDKTILEVVGHGQADLAGPNAEARREHQHEGELKLILSSNLKSWNISENFIAEKNLGHAPWEFGYAAGASRPLRTAFRARECTFCAEKLVAGLEAYGGLGDTRALTVRDTSHYVAPLVGWQLPRGIRLTFSPGFGLTSSSLARVYRAGWAMEVPQMGSWFRSGRRRWAMRVGGWAFRLRSGLVVAAVMVLVATVVFAASRAHWDHIPAKDHARANPLAGQPEAVHAGAILYRDHCQQCHQADAMGDGHKKPSLRNDRIRSATDGDLEWFLRQGDLGHGMPSWSSLPEAQRWQIIAYLRSLH